MEFMRSDKISYKKPPLELFLGEYNTMLASLLVENIKKFPYLASPVINRMEAHTHLYEKLEKYVQIRDILLNNDSIGIIIANEDVMFYDKLKHEFNKRVRKDTGINSGLKSWLKKIKLLVFVVKAVPLFLQSLRLILASGRMPLPKNKYASIIRTYFDFRCKDSAGRLREEYFGPFAVDLAKHENVLIAYKLLHPKDLVLFKELSNGQSDFDSCLIEVFLSPMQLVKTFIKYGVSRIKLGKACYYRNNDITSILQKMIDDDFYNLRGINVFIEYVIAKKIMGLEPERIYIPYENQAWEKVYPLVKSEMKSENVRIIGFQHTGLSYKLVHHFPTEVERPLPLFPDKLLTVGKIYQRLLKEKAHYPCEIVEGAALRHSKHVNNDNGSFNIKMPHKELQRKVVYAFSYDTTKYAKILDLLIDVFKESKITVYLKIHPDYDEDQIIMHIGIKLPRNLQPAQKIPWNKIYDEVDCVIYDDNSIGIEGMINGVRTYMLDLGEPIYDCDRMYYFKEWSSSINEDGLRVLKNEIENGSFDPSYDIEKVKEYVNLYYNAYLKEKYFNNYF